MEQNQGLPLVAYVKDYYRSEFNSYDLSGMSPDDRYALFRNCVMGKLFGEKLSDKDSYISGLIEEAIAINALESTIKLGYDLASTYG